MVLFEWLPKPGFLETFFIPIKPSVFSSVLLYNVPDTLWFLSGIFFLRCIWFYEKKWQNIYLACFYVIALVFEISQLSKNVPGTFDILDLFFMGVTALIEGLLYKIFIGRRLR
jgi:glycopeptide antibiotics resistance protein